MQDGDCPYLARWDAVEAADVIVGGPAHAALDRVVDDRVVIFDEDPGTAYRTEFDANQLSTAISTILSKNDDLPIDNHFGLIGLQQMRGWRRYEMRFVTNSQITPLLPVQRRQSTMMTVMPRPDCSARYARTRRTDYWRYRTDGV